MKNQFSFVLQWLVRCYSLLFWVLLAAFNNFNRLNQGLSDSKVLVNNACILGLNIFGIWFFFLGVLLFLRYVVWSGSNPIGWKKVL